jgi:hypothetical protein
MSQDHRLPQQRFELKYVISEQKARRIRDYVSSFLELDEHCVGKSDFSYAVHSLYIDSDNLQTYWDTINGNKNRFKLRIRYYTEDPHTPVFLEIKRRLDNCIKKQRAAVRREAVQAILAGQLPPAQVLASPDPRALPALQDFCRLVQNVGARPKVHVAYLREAYLPLTENPARLTMDRMVRSEFNPTLELSTRMRNPIVVWSQAVVLELKFIDRFPNWFRDLVRTFDLRQCGAAKYADGVSLLQGRLPHHRHMPQHSPDLLWPARSTPKPHHTIRSRIAAGTGAVDRAAEERALERAVRLGKLQPGESL